MPKRPWVRRCGFIGSGAWVLSDKQAALLEIAGDRVCERGGSEQAPEPGQDPLFVRVLERDPCVPKGDQANPRQPIVGGSVFGGDQASPVEAGPRKRFTDASEPGDQSIHPGAIVVELRSELIPKIILFRDDQGQVRKCEEGDGGTKEEDRVRRHAAAEYHYEIAQAKWIPARRKNPALHQVLGVEPAFAPAPYDILQPDGGCPEGLTRQ